MDTSVSLRSNPRDNRVSFKTQSRSQLLAFQEPGGIIEARTRLASLFAEIRLIETQLQDPNRTDAQGQRLTGREYFAWKKGATYALVAKQSEYQFLKTWILNQRESRVLELAAKIGDGKQMIEALVSVVDHLFDAYPEIGVSAGDQAVLDLARAVTGKQMVEEETTCSKNI